MILTNFPVNFNSFIKNSQNIKNIINDIYFDAVESINFSSIICDRCLNNSWHHHAYYEKQINIYGILIEPMIPYISTLFNDLIRIVIYSIILLDSSLFFIIKTSFHHVLTHIMIL